MNSPVMKTARRVAIVIAGTVVLLIGVVMIVAPGPAVVVIPAGLAILATEFVWARRLLNRVKQKASQVVDHVRGAASGSSDPPAAP